MRFFEVLAVRAVRFRVLVIACWAVALAAAMVALPSLGREVNSDPSLFLSGNAPSVEAAALGAPLPGSGTTGKVLIAAATSGTRLTVLLDTFGVRTLLVPSVVVLLGRWNWWPSRLGKASSAPRGAPLTQDEPHPQLDGS